MKTKGYALVVVYRREPNTNLSGAVNRFIDLRFSAFVSLSFVVLNFSFCNPRNASLKLPHERIWKSNEAEALFWPPTLIDTLDGSVRTSKMLKIIPYGQNTILGDSASDAVDLLVSIVPDEQLCEPAQRPFVQLSHQAIPTEDVEQVLGYAGITTANAPVGLPCDFEPRKLGRNYLLFALPRLEAHLRNTQQDIIAEYERHASFEQLLESRDMTAHDYLVAGLLECIKWCSKHRAGLMIQW